MFGAPNKAELLGALDRVILLLRTELHRSQATVRIELTRPLPAVLGDRVQIQQVLINLIVNGIGTRPGPFVGAINFVGGWIADFIDGVK